MSSILPTYARLPVSFVRGEGVYLWDRSGKRYLDAVAGVAVCSLGHAHPEVREAICRQAGELLHTSNLYRIDRQEQLATELCGRSQMQAAFFCNSGAEANEAAIKIARRYGHQQGVECPAIVVMENSFHGRTLATLSATGNARVQEGFGPLVEGFVRVPHGDAAAVAALDDPSIVAVLVEPIQGEGGVCIPPNGYLAELRRICDRRGWLLMLDEIQTGLGRTGRWFAHQHDGLLPDVMTLAKALGNGVPIGACLTRGHAASVLTAGSHGSTFGGNPLACAAALTVLQIMARDELPRHAELYGLALRDRLQVALSGVAAVRQVRGRGYLLGIELDRPCGALVQQALERGLLINVTAGNVIRLLPPLILDSQQADELVDILCPLIASFSEQPAAQS